MNRNNPHRCPHCNYMAYNVHHLMEHLDSCEPIYSRKEALDKLAERDQKMGLYDTNPLEQEMETGFSVVNPETGEITDYIPGPDIRTDRHGNKEDSFGQIASYWEVFRNYQDNMPEDDVTAALRMVLFKLARFQTTGSDDHLYDLWKYAEEAYNRYSEDGN